MTIAYLRTARTAELLVRVEGHVSQAENARALRAMIEDGAFRDLSRIAIDARDLTSTELSSLDMKWLVSEIGRQLRRGGPAIPVTLCARPDTYGYAIVRVFHSYASMSDVFRIEEIVTECTAACADHAERIRAEGQSVSA